MIDKMEGGKENRQMFPSPCLFLHFCWTVCHGKEKAAVGMTAPVSYTCAVEWVSSGWLCTMPVTEPQPTFVAITVIRHKPGFLGTVGQLLDKTWVQFPGIGEVEAHGEKYQFDHEFYFFVLPTLNIERKSHYTRGQFPVRTNTSSLMVATRDACWMPGVCVTYSTWDEKRGCCGC